MPGSDGRVRSVGVPALTTLVDLVVAEHGWSKVTMQSEEFGGWAASSEAWVDLQGSGGDWSRRHVLDAAMLQLCDTATNVVDIGCGEGRFCRMMTARGLSPIGVDPVERLVEEARRRDPQGDYRLGRAEALPLEDASVGTAVSYLSLVDIPDLDATVREVARVLQPGGRFVIATLTSFTTALAPDHTVRSPVEVHDYLVERAVPVEIGEVQVVNYHRPLSRYMNALLDGGFVMEAFDEPGPDHDSERATRYRQAPWFLTMAWRSTSP